MALGFVKKNEHFVISPLVLSRSDFATAIELVSDKIEELLARNQAVYDSLPRRLAIEHKFRCVKGASAASARGIRKEMEDEDIILEGCLGDESIDGFFGLYDGHGGTETVDLLVRVFHENVALAYRALSSLPFSEVWSVAYKETDAQIRRMNILRSGATAVTCVIHTQNGRRFLETANVGDSRAVLVRGGQAVRLSFDHKPGDPGEKLRIQARGGFVSASGRANGILAVSRAFGDHLLKEGDIISAVPHCCTHELTDEDTYLLLACDGVFDVMDDQHAVNFLMEAIQNAATSSDSGGGGAREECEIAISGKGSGGRVFEVEDHRQCDCYIC